MVACLGAFSRGVAVSTVYTNLGEDGVVHAMNETKVKIQILSYFLVGETTFGHS